MIRLNFQRAFSATRPLLSPGRLPLLPTSVRYTSLSAIHRGLRRSEKIQYGEPRPRPTSTRGRKTKADKIIARTEKALEGATSDRKRSKLLKKLQKKEDEKAGNGKQTRRKRFIDENSEFGKKSIVWQLKHGSLKNLADDIDLEEPVRPRSTERDTFRQRRIALREERSRGRDDRPRSATRQDSWPRPERLSHEQTQRLREDLRRVDEEDSPASSRTSRLKPSRGWGRDHDGDTEVAKARERRGKMMPMTIQYTTAASQFLYGKSVVKSAFEQGRRKLYKLYIYGGENRQDSKENEVIKTLAHKAKVPITIVPTEGQRLMDKMSMGRPHNGFVLETSPLPQLPVASLGQIEESVGRLGFHVRLDHQSKEEEAVNGTNTFVERTSNLTPKPFVLLLNEILDPGNLGGLLRTASYMGVDAVGITNRSTAALSPVVLKSAAGAVEEVTLFTVDDPVKFIEGSKEAGWKTYAAVAPPSKKLAERHTDKFISTELVEQQGPLARDPCVLMLGNEGFGLSKALKMAADYEVSVPRFIQDSCVDSLNVSVAAGLLCHSFVKKSAANKTGIVAENKTGESKATGANTAGSEEAVF